MFSDVKFQRPYYKKVQGKSVLICKIKQVVMQSELSTTHYSIMCDMRIVCRCTCEICCVTRYYSPLFYCTYRMPKPEL